ncbi:HAD hydrolase-like protein [Paenibacillus segetis]|uniref:MTA/SAH nucleosidase n=1 Tax=Paenibacillus segetis TaxID=1325360 RepID=A0ABQ1YEG5_9BACL|nr:HAD hydrolase-like protein [Paenibacillus segetis]GGH21550.1 MTA/SAH nucleosidase [Paenibacillus segetis]
MPLSIIFDMDGTLFQTNKILGMSVEDTFAYLTSLNEWSGEAPLQKYHEIMGAPVPVVWETLLPNHSNELRHKANDFFHERLISNINHGNGALYDHVYELFDYLKQEGISIFIASNGQVEYLNAILSFYKLDSWVTETFSISQIQTLSKTDLVSVILQKYHIEHAVMVGDRLSDILAGKNNDLMSIGCRFDFSHEDELAQADVVIDDLLELRAIIGNVLNTEPK